MIGSKTAVNSKPRDMLLTWMDLSSGNGFKRERALRTLSDKAPNRFFLILAIRRLNDWVPQVREAAIETIFDIAQRSSPEDVVDVLCAIVPHWNSWKRLGDDGRQVLLNIIAIESISDSFKSKIITATSGPIASILAQISRHPIFDKHLDDIAKTAVQPFVRAKAYRCLFEQKTTWIEGKKWQCTDKRYGEGYFAPVIGEREILVNAPFLATLKRAVIDKSPAVRRVAGEMLIRDLNKIGDEAVVLATLLAADNSPSVAERGEFAIKRLKEI